MSHVAQATSSERTPARRPARPLSLYVRVVVLLGAGVVVGSLFNIPSMPQPFAWLLFTAVALVAGGFTMKIPSVVATASISDTFFISAAMLFGAGPAAITLAISGGFISWRRRHGRMRLAFNAM